MPPTLAGEVWGGCWLLRAGRVSGEVRGERWEGCGRDVGGMWEGCGRDEEEGER